MPRQIVIVGGPHTGKTTLAERLKNEFDIASVMHSTDDLIGLGWSEASEAASHWFNNAGDWIIEGVSTARALRKWLTANPGSPLDADILMLDEAFTPLLKGQQSMTAGVHTVFREIEPELTRRGARIQKLKNANDAIKVFGNESLTNPARQRKQRSQTTMLKTYEKLEDVPEALREHYKLIQGKYVPDLSDDHPVLVNNKTLLNEKNAAETKASGFETKVTELQADIQSAKASGLPRGHRAVTVADAEAIDKLKEHGTSQEIVTKLTEHKTLKEESAKRNREDSLRSVAKELGYNADAFVLLPNLPEFEIREKDGKKTVIAKVKGEGDTITERPAQEFIEASDALAPLLPALKMQSSGIPVPGQTRDSGKPSQNIYSDIRATVKKSEEEATKANSIPLSQRRGITEIGGIASA